MSADDVSCLFLGEKVRCALGSAPGFSPWLFEQYDSQHGSVRRHTFGPWPLTDKSSARRVLSLWYDLAAARLPVKR